MYIEGVERERETKRERNIDREPERQRQADRHPNEKNKFFFVAFFWWETNQHWMTKYDVKPTNPNPTNIRKKNKANRK